MALAFFFMLFKKLKKIFFFKFSLSFGGYYKLITRKTDQIDQKNSKRNNQERSGRYGYLSGNL